MRNFFKKNLFFLLIFTMFLLGSLFAVNYFNSKNIFDAEISYLNNVKIPYSVIVDFQNKVNTNLNYDVEIVYLKKNLVVSSKSFTCLNNCEKKLVLNRIFFDKYRIIIQTKYKGKFYKKELNFKLQKLKNNNRLILKKKIFVLKNKKTFIKGKLLLNKPSRIRIITFPENDTTLKTSFEKICQKDCNFKFGLNSTILLGKYILQVYLPNDVLKGNYTLYLRNNFSKINLDKNYDNYSSNFNKNINKKYIEKKLKINNNSKKIVIKTLFGKNVKVFLNSSSLNSNLNGISSINSINSKNLSFNLKTKLLSINSIKKLDDVVNLTNALIIKKSKGLSVLAGKNFTKSNFKYLNNPVVYNQTEIVGDNGKIQIQTNLNNKSNNKNNNSFNKVEQRKLIPGIYKKERIIRYLDGTEIIKDNFFAYGLISINTLKPIYHKNERVDFLIVVLDKWGRLVSNAPIKLTISTPDKKKINLTSQNLDIYETIKKGVYKTSFIPKLKGKYNLTADVIVENMTLKVNSFFNVVNFYPFDIIRNVPSTIDPWQGPFNNSFKIIPLNNYTGLYNFTEVFSSDFTNISTNADENETIGNTIYLHWNNLKNISNLKYSAQVPLKTPYLYYLGKSYIDYNKNYLRNMNYKNNKSYITKRFYENRSWLFAIDPAGKVCTFNSPCICGSSCNNGNEPGSATIDTCTDGNTQYEYVNNVRVNDLNGSYYGTGDTIQFCIDNNCDTSYGGDRSIMAYKTAVTSWVSGDILFQTGGTSSGTACVGITTYCKNVILNNYIGTHNFRGGVVWTGNSNQICENKFYRDYDDINITVLERRAANVLTWNLNNMSTIGNNLNVIRGKNLTIFAKWDKPIKSGFITHNGSGVFTDFQISNLNTNYTNYTADTSNITEFSKLGPISSNITSNDLYFNLSNTTFPNKIFNIYGVLKVNQSKMTPYIMYNGSQTNISCQVTDENVDIAYPNVSVSFYNNVSGLIGTSLTNSTGWANISYIENIIGNYTITCNFTNQLSNYYYAGLNNYANQILTVKKNNTDITPPKITNILSNPNLFSVGGKTTISANVTDDINLTNVYLNVTIPNGNSYVYLMNNILGDRYEYNFSNTISDGLYSYYIYAYDNSSNKGFTSVKNFDVVGIRTYVGIKTTKDIYKIGEKINLTIYQKFSSLNNSIFYEKGDTGNYFYSFDSNFQGWVSGGVQNQWQWGKPTSGFNSNCDLSKGVGNNCLAINLPGNYNSNANEWVESPAIDFTGRTNVKVNFWRSLELQDGTTNDRAYFEGFDGSVWKIYFQDSLLGGGVPYTLNPGFSTYYLPELDGINGGKIRFRLTSNGGTNYDGWDVDSINISFTPRQNWNKNWSYYNNSFGLDNNKTTAIKIKINITSYNSSGSDMDGTTNPDLEIQIYNGTAYSNNYFCNLDSTKTYPYNCEIVIKNTPEYLNSWKFSKNRSIRIRAINLDSKDYINWTNIKREYITPSIIENHGIAQVTSYLLEQFKNSTNGIVKTMYNNSIVLNSGQAKQLNSYWNFSVPFGFSLGNYFAYVALTDSNNNILQNQDDNTYINDSYPFSVQSLLINVKNPLLNSVQNEDFLANISLNTTYFGSGGWCSYNLDNSTSNISMNQISPTNFNILVNNKIDGSHFIKFYCNDTDNYIVNSPTIYFNISQNPRISFVNPTDLNNAYVNRSWIYINVSVNDSSNTSSYIDFNRSLIGYWNFENTSGTKVYDSSSYGNNGTFVNGGHINNTNMIRGKYGEFDGVNDYIKINMDNSLVIDDNLTISAWIKWSGSGNPLQDIYKNGRWDNSLRIDGSSGQILFELNDGSTNNLYSTNSIAVNKWVHVVGVFNNSKMQLYINGKLNNTKLIGNKINSFYDENDIGSEVGNYYFKGSIDEVMLWDRALSNQEIKALYNSKINQLENNFTSLKNENYSYSACSIDIIGNQNCTQKRIININKTLPKINIQNPLNNSKFISFDNIFFNSSVDVNSSELIGNLTIEFNSNGTKFDLRNFSNYNWTYNSSFTTGIYNFKIFGLDIVGNNFSSKIYNFLVIPNKDTRIEKTINFGSNPNSYNVNLNLSNFGKWKNHTIVDFVDNKFSYGSFSSIPNLIENVFSFLYSGFDFIWNESLNLNSSKSINYMINSSNNSHLLNNYLVGLE